MNRTSKAPGWGWWVLLLSAAAVLAAWWICPAWFRSPDNEPASTVAPGTENPAPPPPPPLPPPTLPAALTNTPPVINTNPDEMLR